MSNKFLFLSFLIPKDDEETAILSKGNMQDAASALQWNIIDGIEESSSISLRIINVLPVGSFPQYYARPFVKKFEFFSAKNKHTNIRFCNIKFLRKVFLPVSIYKEIYHALKSDKSCNNLIVYTISGPFMKALAKIKKHFPDLKICAVVADLPEYSSLSDKKSWLMKTFIKCQTHQAYANLQCVDSYILLTEQMASYLRINKPYMVMEGIATDMPYSFSDGDDVKTIMYAGTLHKRFGVMNLVNAFMQIKDDKFRLVICGIGDSESEIVEAAKRDSRILFLGQKKRSEVLSLIQKSTLLVNPRQNNEDFTKYSFPSKTMEYLSSGVPVLAYKLDGIPNEYDDYINYVPGNDIKSLKDSIVSICNLTTEKRKEMGLRGRNFVLHEKNKTAQARKIEKFLGNWLYEK